MMNDFFIFLFFLFFLIGCSSPMIQAVPNPAVASVSAGASIANSFPQSTPMDCGVCLRECSKILDDGILFYTKMQRVGTTVALREAQK